MTMEFLMNVSLVIKSFDDEIASINSKDNDDEDDDDDGDD